MERGMNPWEVFNKEKPDVVKAFLELMKSINEKDVLDKKTMELILVGIHSTIREPGALRHHAGEALKAGATKEQVEAAALLAFSTGVPSAELSLPIILDLVGKQNVSK